MGFYKIQTTLEHLWSQNPPHLKNCPNLPAKTYCQTTDQSTNSFLKVRVNWKKENQIHRITPRRGERLSKHTDSSTLRSTKALQSSNLVPINQSPQTYSNTTMAFTARPFHIKANYPASKPGERCAVSGFYKPKSRPCHLNISGVKIHPIMITLPLPDYTCLIKAQLIKYYSSLQ